MAKVLWDVSMSLDGFIADSKDRLGRLFDWYYSGDVSSTYNAVESHPSLRSNFLKKMRVILTARLKR